MLLRQGHSSKIIYSVLLESVPISQWGRTPPVWLRLWSEQVTCVDWSRMKPMPRCWWLSVPGDSRQRCWWGGWSVGQARWAVLSAHGLQQPCFFSNQDFLERVFNQERFWTGNVFSVYSVECYGWASRLAKEVVKKRSRRDLIVSVNKRWKLRVQH